MNVPLAVNVCGVLPFITMKFGDADIWLKNVEAAATEKLPLTVKMEVGKLDCKVADPPLAFSLKVLEPVWVKLFTVKLPV